MREQKATAKELRKVLLAFNEVRMQRKKQHPILSPLLYAYVNFVTQIAKYFTDDTIEPIACKLILDFQLYF